MNEYHLAAQRVERPCPAAGERQVAGVIDIVETSFHITDTSDAGQWSELTSASQRR